MQTDNIQKLRPLQTGVTASNSMPKMVDSNRYTADSRAPANLLGCENYIFLFDKEHDYQIAPYGPRFSSTKSPKSLFRRKKEGPETYKTTEGK